MNAAAAATVDPRPRASVTDWVAVFAGALGALMATLDISITNAALPQIQGEVGASGTEGTWIGTGYLVAEVAVIPLTAWLTRVLGLRNLLLGCAVLFTAFSVLCGLSHDLTMLIIGRIGQGFTGGALIPTGQTIIRTRLPQWQLPVGMTIFGMIVMTGPMIGPLIGGWLTENVTWRWCFFINVPTAAALISLLWFGLPHVAPRFKLFFTADWAGILGLTTCISCLTVVLEEGQRDRWFDSNLIVALSACSALGFVLLMFAQATAREPVVKLRLLLNPRFAGVIAIVLSLGTVMYSILYVLPQFLSGVSGYNADQAGRILFISGIPTFILAPILARLMGQVNMRLLVIIGLLCFAASCFLDIHLTPDSVGHDFIWSQILRGCGQMCALLPLNQAVMTAVSREEAPEAAGLYSMFRNLGGSIGLAGVGILIDRRTEFHADVIRESVNANAPLVQDRLAGMAGTFLQRGADPAYAHMQTLRMLAGQIHLQAMVMTYSDCFWILGVILLAGIPLTMLLRTPKTRIGAAVEMH